MSLLTCAFLAWAVSAQDAKPMPLVDATALASSDGRLYAGTSTGEVMVYDSRTREPLSALTSQRKGAVSLVTASPYGVAWLVGPRAAAIKSRLGDSIDVAMQTLIVRTPDEKTVTIDLRPAGVESPVRALGWLGPRLVLLQDFGASFYNARTGAVELPESFLPATLAKEVASSRVWVSDPFLMTARPTAMRRNSRSTGLPYVSMFSAYKFENNRWARRSGFASNALDVEPFGELSVGDDGKIPADTKFKIVSETVGFDASGAAAIEGGSLLDAPLFSESWETARHPLPSWLAEPGHPDPLWFQIYGDDAWWWTGSALIKQSRSTGGSKAFLPWNDAQMIPNAFLPDASGLWIATNVGVRRLELGQPEKPLGYGGFISVPLGPDTERTDDKKADKIVQGLYKWRFATPDLAGKDGARMVSEVFKSIGVILPPNQTDISTSPFGEPVVDELKIGDVISSAKGLAVYIGNGKTVEMKDGAIRNGTVWSRPFAVVRRFVKP